jgi:hypothetical protein
MQEEPKDIKDWVAALLGWFITMLAWMIALAFAYSVYMKFKLLVH